MRKLKEVIRRPDFNAEEFGGYLVDKYQFQRIFFLGKNDVKDTLEEIDQFLEKNGYERFDSKSISEYEPIEFESVRIAANPFVNNETRSLILTIKRFDPWDNPVDRLLMDLIEFRDKRDWAQFHNSKDLALALSIEASELLELFLWKGNEEADENKLKEELADVFLYGLLLMEKHGFDFEEILSEKIQSNDKKYPVSKAKGTAKKYDEL